MELFDQIVVQRGGPGLHVRHGVELALALFFDAVGRGTRAGGEIILGPVGRHLQQPLEVGLVTVLVVDDKLALLDALLSGGRLGGRRLGGLAFSLFVGTLFKNHVVLQLLLDAVVEGHHRQLEDLHRLDHARSQLHLLAHLHVL